MTTTNHSMLFLAAETALTSDERTRFLSRFDPSYSGGHVANVLERLDSTDFDFNRGIVEAMYEYHNSEVAEPGLLGTATRLAVSLQPQESETHEFEKTWEVVRVLIERIRPLLGLDEHDLRNERVKRDKLEQLAPIGFHDYDDGEMPDAIWHHAAGIFNHHHVRLDNVIDLVYAAGFKAGSDSLRKQLRALIGAAPIPSRED